MAGGSVVEPISTETSAIAGTGIMGAIIAWFLRNIYSDNKAFQKAAWGRMDTLNASLNTHVVYVAGECVKRPEIDKLREHIDQKFDDLNATLLNTLSRR